MSQILISWIARNNDFLDKEGSVNQFGPTYTFHKKFYKYDKHILLSRPEDDLRLDVLVNALKKDFKDHVIEPKYMNISSVIDLKEIYGKVQPFLYSLKEHEITIFISPGTPTMQVAWYLAHMNLNLKTTLVQTVSEKIKGKTGTELFHVDIERSLVPAAALIKEYQANGKTDETEEYKITASIAPIYQKAFKVAEADNVTVLIMGDSGTGKEHLARYIHDHSPRRSQPFTAINCSAFSDSLLESRLFGYKKGAFTDAKQDTKGIFELANGGTIFLDEIGDISPYMQQSLLRVIQQKEITPIGDASKKVDVRIVSATNKDLTKECSEGRFRWDLFYRLSTIELKLPPLLDRGQKEVHELLDYFIKMKQRVFGRKKPLQVDTTTKQLLLNYHWPGNVRELENVVENLYVFNDSVTSQDSLPARLLEDQATKPLNWEFVEAEHIKKVLKISKGNQNKAAEMIGYAINTLRTKMKNYKIEPNHFKST